MITDEEGKRKETPSRRLTHGRGYVPINTFANTRKSPTNNELARDLINLSMIGIRNHS